MTESNLSDGLIPHTDFWNRASASGLANHFHGKIEGLKTSRPISRVESLYLSEADLKKLMDQTKLPDVFHIEFALTDPEGRGDKVTFVPQITGLHDSPLSFSMGVSPVSNGDDPIPDGDSQTAGIKAKSDQNVDEEDDVDAREVPQAYLDVVRQSWLNLDPSLIDDVFLKREREKSLRHTELKRLSSYPIHKSSSNHLLYQAIKEGLPNVEGDAPKGVLKDIIFHLGVDLNRLPLSDEFTFAPVIELKYSNGLFNIESSIFKAFNQLGRISSLPRFVPGLSAKSGSSSGTPGSAFFDFLRPCPPFCP